MDTNFIKTKNKLYTCGSGIILFALWDAIRAVLFCFLGSDDLFTQFNFDVSMTIVKAFTYTIALIIVGILTYLHIYVGKKAQSEAKGDKVGSLYIIFTALLLVYSIYSVFEDVNSLLAGNLSKLSLFVEVIIELTEIALTIELLVYSIQVKKYKEVK